MLFKFHTSKLVDLSWYGTQAPCMASQMLNKGDKLRLCAINWIYQAFQLKTDSPPPPAKSLVQDLHPLIPPIACL